ncbi:50S ribosomal protein L33 [Candidatus Mycoplasma haematobovis]|uniref:50S ribosomal protein L33 n=1 Tax=Candidatus Mycoplasma haematobovis TaxID=432608 RepID=UPI000A864391|nr:50S ribosomal protein L33 [Candidatus Mycoplasma haematobovis]
MPKLKIRFKCKECSNIGYLSRKNPKNTVDKLQLKKYCKWCRKSIVHQEIKIK